MISSSNFRNTAQVMPGPRGTCTDIPYPIGPKNPNPPEGEIPSQLWRGADDRRAFLRAGGDVQIADMIGRSADTYGFRNGRLFKL
jgi:hypothetical protein